MIPRDALGAVLSRVEANREEQVEVTRGAVRIPSVTGDEGPIQRYLADLYRRLGLDVVLLVPDRERLRAHEAFADSGLPFTPERPNVIGIAPGDGAGRSLTLHGHVDVVSPEPLSAWTRDPWGGEVSEGRLYGRGAGDMKAGMMAGAFALKAVLDAGLRPRGRVQLMSTIEEESGGVAARLPAWTRATSQMGS